jgi:hypothetical protein
VGFEKDEVVIYRFSLSTEVRSSMNKVYLRHFLGLLTALKKEQTFEV